MGLYTLKTQTLAVYSFSSQNVSETKYVCQNVRFDKVGHCHLHVHGTTCNYVYLRPHSVT